MEVADGCSGLKVKGRRGVLVLASFGIPLGGEEEAVSRNLSAKRKKRRGSFDVDV